MNKPFDPDEREADRSRSIRALEEAVTELLFRQELWAPAATAHDRKMMRRDLLEAARRYGRAVDALARKR